MGEVYRAHDPKLKRDVALKILPDAFVTDRDRLARFEREAQVLASLNHPNIAHVHGLEDAGAVRALVMELVEGEDLAERVARGPIPLDEALPIAVQIVEALEAAHRQGIIHRDLKPANIKLRSDGVVKVLDFGLAKAMEPMGVAADLSKSPTLMTPAMMTGVGMILGTAGYMSPEQAKGHPADTRADIWAFGTIVFEMLTGKRLFTGETISETLAAILKTDPDWRLLPGVVPLGLRRLLRRCLEKDPKRRLQAIGDARIEIADIVDGRLDPELNVRTRSTWRRVVPWTASAALALGLAAVLVFWVPWRHPPASAPVQVSTDLGVDVILASGAGVPLSISPDGSMAAFVGRKVGGDSSQLYLRRLAQLQATALPGTDSAENPFFSPDSQWIGFFARGKLKKIAVTGGAAFEVCAAENGRGGSWSEDGTILFSPSSRPAVRLMRVSAEGGTPVELISIDDPHDTQRWPQALPNGRVLFTSGTIGAYNDASLVVQTLATGARTTVQRGGFYGRYLPSGHLVYLNGGTLFAAPFDLDRLITGPSVRVVDGVLSNVTSGSAQFAVSGNGSLIYLAGQGVSGGLPIEWMNRQGQATPLLATPKNWTVPNFAPDGRSVSMTLLDADGTTHNIWVYDWSRDQLTQVTFDPADDVKSVWSPDGSRLVFGSTRAGKLVENLWWQRADGSGPAQQLTTSKNRQLPGSWHPKLKFLAFEELTQATGSDLMILPIEGDEASGWKPGQPTVFANDPAMEHDPVFSPDGRWIAYTSNETGRFEVWVRPFPGNEWKRRISNGGGFSPAWSRSRHEILYGTQDGQIMTVTYSIDASVFQFERPQLWSEGRFEIGSSFVFLRAFDLHPDGDRVAVASRTDTVNQDKIVLLLNFFDELRRLTSGSR
jgi:serine/threonine protein kinase/Tol biopolymer transport system component